MMNQLQQALQWIEEGKVEKGLEFLHKCEHNADDNEKYLIFEQYQQFGLVNDAMRILLDLLEKYPNDSELLLFAADLYIDLDEEEKAIDCLTKIDSNDDNYVSSLLLLADLYQMQGLDEVAEQKLQQAYQLDPSNHLLAFALGEYYLSQNDDSKAIPYYEQVLTKTNTVLETSIDLQLAKALSSIGEFEHALGHYNKGLEHKIELDALFGAGVTAFYVEEYEQAVKRLKQLKDIDPEYTTLYLYLAKAYEKLGMIEEAKATVYEGMRLDEYNEELYYYAGQMAIKEKQWIEAISYFNKVLNLQPFHQGAIDKLAELYIERKQYEDVVQLFWEVKDEGMADHYHYWYFAKALYETEKYDQAMDYYEKASQELKTDVSFLEDYANVLMSEGDRKKAIAVLSEALKLDATLTHIEDRLNELRQDEW